MVCTENRIMFWISKSLVPDILSVRHPVPLRLISCLLLLHCKFNTFEFPYKPLFVNICFETVTCIKSCERPKQYNHVMGITFIVSVSLGLSLKYWALQYMYVKHLANWTWIYDTCSVEIVQCQSNCLCLHFLPYHDSMRPLTLKDCVFEYVYDSKWRN